MTNPQDKLTALLGRAAAPKPPVDDIDRVLGDVLSAPSVTTPPVSAPAPATAPVAAEAPAPVKAKAKEEAFVVVEIDESQISSDLGALELQAAIRSATQVTDLSTFKVAALQSGYTAVLGALNFEDITRLQSASLDNHAAKMKLLRTLHSRVVEFSCDPIPFDTWVRSTAQGDFDTLMYGLYAATYPGENEFEVGCRHCGHENKLTVPVGHLARAASDDVYQEIARLLDPATDYKGAVKTSLVGLTVQRKLPVSGIVVEIRNPSMLDYLDNVQWFVEKQDARTGMLPEAMAGSEVQQTLLMYVPRLLVPVGNGRYAAVTEPGKRSSILRKLDKTDGRALIDAVDAQSSKLEVNYMLPKFNCRGCGKANDDLMLDFERLLFIKLRGKA